MFDVPALEPVLRAAILVFPILVIIVLFTLLYYRAQTSGHTAGGSARSEGGTDVFEGARLLTAEPASAETILALEERLKMARAADEPCQQAELYLCIARARISAGEETAGLNALRSAAGLAARHGPPAVHAQARIELAEAALRAGDPTSACEHWQMARMAFLDEGNRAGGEQVDQRMRANGCPTDWVLTDF